MDKATTSLEKSLRQKFVRVSFSVVFVVLFVILVVANGFNYHQVEKKAEELLDMIANNDGTLPLPSDDRMPPEELTMEGVPSDDRMPPEDFPMEGMPEEGQEPDSMVQPRPEAGRPEGNPTEPHQQFHLFEPIAPSISEELSFTTRFFTVKFNGEGEVIGVDTTNVNRINVAAAISMATEVFDIGNSNKLEEFFYFQRVSLDNGDILVIFVDVNEDLYFFQSFLYISLGIGVVALLAVFILLVFLSKKAVSPIVEAYARQKVFITDMSHELKTPLAIIKANTEVIELENGNSPWTESVHKQIEKLNYLIVRLLSLAKLEEESIQGEVKDFSLSDMVRESGENFALLLSAQDKNMELAIEEGIHLLADPESILQMLDILLENASKYSNKNSSVVLSLKKGKHSIKLVVENQGSNLKKGSYDAWFQRFFREEHSRNSETGGFGLGLSLAKTLAKNNEAKISAYSPDGKTVKVKVEFKP